MIKYALVCKTCGHRFDGWFPNAQSYDEQAEAGLVSCPACEGTRVTKQVMAPAVARRSDASPGSMADMIAAVRRHVQETYTYVGEDFAAQAQAMHDGDEPSAPIYGEASSDEVRDLVENEVPVAPLPEVLAPPRAKKLN